MHFCTVLISSKWCPLWACAATKGSSLSCKVCISTWSGVVGLCSFSLYFFLQHQRMGSTGKVRCSSGGCMQQWRNVTLCRTPADCNLPALSGAGWLRSPIFVNELFSCHFSNRRKYLNERYTQVGSQSWISE